MEQSEDVHADRQRRHPAGPLVLRTLAMPKDANPRGDMFGGWLLSQMDIAAGLMSSEVSQGRAVTVSVNEVVFYKPVAVGDTICVHAQLLRVGRTSMDIHLEVWARGMVCAFEEERELVAEGQFRYVATDTEGRPRPIQDNPKFFVRD
jgi:acyl-CoA thioesterase YciA